jgi:hypothetical protein
METADIIKVLAGGLAIGLILGFYVGQRDALRHLYKIWPLARNDIMAAGFRDPSRPWWKIAPSFWWVGAAVLAMVVLAEINDRPALEQAAREAAQEAEAAPFPPG